MSDELKRCGNCGEVIPSDAPEGVCPQCVLLRATAGSGGGEGVVAGAVGLEEVRGLFPNLEIERELGRGGMGVVFKGRQVSLGRDVAVKLLRSGVDGDAERDERFLREARALAKLEHPGVTAVYDFGRAGDFWFLVTEFIDGESLDVRLRRGAIDEDEALDIWKEVAAAITYAHGKGVVHRDVKPGNVLLGANGEVKVADFGLAKVLGGDGGGFTLTLESQALGTPYYMAPEQRSAGAVDERADVYGLGVLLFEMLTGKVPEVSAEVPRELGRFEKVVMRAMRAEPGERFASVGEMVAAIGGGGVAAKKPWGFGVVFRKRWWAFLLGVLGGPVVGCVLAMGAAYLLPTMYESRMVIQVERQPEVAAVPMMQTQIQVIQGSLVLGKVIDELKLERRWILEREEAIEAARGSLGVETIRGTDLLSVSVRRPDPAEAAEIANAIWESYRHFLLESRSEDGQVENTSVPVMLHEKAEVAGRPVSRSSWAVMFMGMGFGVLGAIPSGVLLMYLVHRVVRWK